MQPGVFTGAGVDQAGQSHVRHLALFPSSPSSPSSLSSVRPATVEVGERLVLGQTGRGGGKQRVVDAQSCQSSNSDGHSATRLGVSILAMTGVVVVVVVVVPQAPGDREHQRRR